MSEHIYLRDKLHLDRTPFSFIIFTKRGNFYDFLFAFLDHETLPKRVFAPMCKEHFRALLYGGLW